MPSYKLLSPIGLIYFILSCSSPAPKLDGVDIQSWKQDRNGCNGWRRSAIGPITEQREKLKKLSEMDLVALLGRPDENQLLSRNQKFFIYYLEPGPQCDTTGIDAKKLIVRFNAMGLAKESMVK